MLINIYLSTFYLLLKKFIVSYFYIGSVRMKRFLIMLLLININFLVVDVKAASNPYKETSRFGTNCTWYAWKNAYERGGVTLPGWGNAKNWATDAQKSGYQVGDTPKSNSIMVNPNLTDWGHVIYVESVKGSKMYIWDTGEPCHDNTTKAYQDCIDATYDPVTDMYNNDEFIACYYAQPLSACEANAIQGGSIKYIYLDSAPKTTTKATTKKTTTTSTTTSTTKVKSNNTYLSDITIENINFDFNKDTFEYEINVDYQVDNITIDAIPDDENSIVQGFGQRELEIGENIIEIFVTAEDESQSTYVLKVNRSDKEEIPTTTKTIQEKKNNKLTKKDYIFIGGLISLLIVIGVIVLIIIKKRRRKL